LLWNSSFWQSLWMFSQVTSVFFTVSPFCTSHFTKKCCTEYLYFRTSITTHHCAGLSQVALVSSPRHKFLRPPCWYYRS
jgi:hypothetical protein